MNYLALLPDHFIPTSTDEFADYNSWGGELGFRFFFLSRQARWRPYVAISGGASYVDNIEMSTFADLMIGGSGDDLVLRATFFNESWIGTGSVVLGLDVNLNLPLDARREWRCSLRGASGRQQSRPVWRDQFRPPLDHSGHGIHKVSILANGELTASPTSMNDTLVAYHFFFAGFAFVLGAVVGSFLNVCIYRMPLDLSVNEPRRSFAQRARTDSVVSEYSAPELAFSAGTLRELRKPNRLPLFRGGIADRPVFSRRLAQFPWGIALAYWVFVSLLIVGTFIDFEHFIIPDEVTIGGTVAGIVASFLVPALMATDGRLDGAPDPRALSAALGYAILWIVLEAGKKVFGKKRIRVGCAHAVHLDPKGRRRRFRRRRGETDYGAIIFRAKTISSFCIATKRNRWTRPRENGSSISLQSGHDRRAKNSALTTLEQISGVVRELQIPREAMGRGDLKFLAAIGAFLGWRAVLFSVFAGSLLGSLVGLATLLIGQRVWSAKLPFGPYLAFGGVALDVLRRIAPELVSGPAQSVARVSGALFAQ